MSYKVKPILKLYKYENSTFVLQAIIDDYSEVSFEHNLYQAGTFTISINYNIPNSQLFQRCLFVQFGNNPGDFGEIYSIQDSISKDGKGSQTRTIVGYDARYILKRRVIKNMNSNGLWTMTAKGELCIRNLIKDQCGVDAEEKRRLPIINNIPDVSEAKGKEYSVSEQFTNLYEVCKTIATQSEIGWRISFINNELNLEIYEGEDLSQTVRFDTNYESLANGKFSDSSESFSNAIYIGGKGQNDSRDIYEGENGTPSGFNRFESWDNQSQMTTEDEYETEAISMLSQYGQTLTITGNGLVKCPYVFREQYNVGDVITVAFSGKSAAAQILSVTEHWSFGNYEINFNFGKPQNNLSDQLQLMLRQIQKASETSNSTESVKWYNVANENTMDSSDVTYNTIGFTGAMTSNKTFTFYLDNEKTGAKSYNIYAKNLTGNYNLTLTTGRSGKTNVVLKGGVNITSRILIDEEGNIISQGMTSTSVVQSGNNQPVTSDAIAGAINQSDYLYDYNASLLTPQWVKICTFGFRNNGSTLELDCYSNFKCSRQGSHIIKIAYGWIDVTVEDTAKDVNGVFDKVRICWNNNNEDRLALYVHYNKGDENGVCFKIKGTSNDITKVYALNADPTVYADYKEFNLGTNGLTVNGEKLENLSHYIASNIYPSSLGFQVGETVNIADFTNAICDFLHNSKACVNINFIWAYAQSISLDVNGVIINSAGLTIIGNITIKEAWTQQQFFLLTDNGNTYRVNIIISDTIDTLIVRIYQINGAL